MRPLCVRADDVKRIGVETFDDAIAKAKERHPNQFFNLNDEARRTDRAAALQEFRDAARPPAAMAE